MRGIGKGRELHLPNNFAFDNVDMVDRMRHILKTDRIGTCLDTCHMMLTQKYIRGLYEMVGDIAVPDLSTRKFFEMNKPFLKLIHLADMTGSGYGKGRHGIPFYKETEGKLKGIMDIYNSNNIVCPITLEVEETDFSVSSGYRQTKELVSRYIK